MKPRFILPQLLIALSFSFHSYAQEDCDCTFTIEPSTDQIVFNGEDEGAKPGDVICLNAGEYFGIKFEFLAGSVEEPILIKNCGGIALFRPSIVALDVQNSSDFIISGTGSDQDFYGIQIEGGVTSARIGFFSNRYELDHVSADSAKQIGFSFKNDPDCRDPRTWRNSGNYNEFVKVHHSRITRCGQEAIYVGDSRYHIEVDCQYSNEDNPRKKVEETPILRAEVYNNIVEDCGRDGIQVGSVIERALIYNNIVRRYGLNYARNNDKWEALHRSGFQINPATKAILYNNQVYDGSGTAYFLNGNGVTMFNNLAYNAETAIEGYEKWITEGAVYKIYNNTFLEIYGNVVSAVLDRSTRPNNIFVNNILHYTGSDDEVYQFKSTGAWLDENNRNNIITSVIDTLGLADITEENFTPMETSSLVDQGDCSVDENLYFDGYGEDRVYQSSCDIGAYEFIPVIEEPIITEITSPTSNQEVVFPNPIIKGQSEAISVNLGSTSIQKASYSLYDVTGEVQLQGNSQVQAFDIPLPSSIATGIYVLKIELEDAKKEISRRICIQ